MGSRSNAYLVLSVYIAQFEEYSAALVEHLSEKKIGHWDVNVRELTAKALNKLASVAEEFLSKKVIPELLKNIEETKDLYVKHGSILAVGEAVLGLANLAQGKERNLTDYLGKLYCARAK